MYVYEYYIDTDILYTYRYTYPTFAPTPTQHIAGVGRISCPIRPCQRKITCIRFNIKIIQVFSSSWTGRLPSHACRCRHTCTASTHHIPYTPSAASNAYTKHHEQFIHHTHPSMHHRQTHNGGRVVETTAIVIRVIVVSTLALSIPSPASPASRPQCWASEDWCTPLLLPGSPRTKRRAPERGVRSGVKGSQGCDRGQRGRAAAPPADTARAKVSRDNTRAYQPNLLGLPPDYAHRGHHVAHVMNTSYVVYLANFICDTDMSFGTYRQVGKGCAC